MDHVSWIKKYMPKKLSDIDGQGFAIEELKKFVNNFKKGKALLLYGESGGGKTASVYALAHDINVEIVEINASDTRNAEQITSLLGSASKQASLFFKSKIILVDEIDGITGREDRGGVQAIVKLIDSSTFPIILVANNPFGKKFSSLRKKSVLLEFKTRHHETVIKLLKKICKEEKISFDDDALSMLARKSGGDVRAVINDLQSIGSDNRKITRKDVEEYGDRDKTESINQALLKVFKTTDVNVALGAFDNVDEDLDKIFLWIEYNMPKEYIKPLDLARGFDALSKADVFKGRIRRWQYFRFYVYCYNLLSAGVALAKDEKYKNLIQYKPTSRLLKLWFAKQRNAKKKAIAEKIGDKTHTSTKRALQDTLPYLRPVFKHNKKEAEKITDYLDLDAEQVEWMGK